MPIIRTLRAGLLLTTIGLHAIPSAHADMLIKRVKCKDMLDPQLGVPVFWNTASFDKHMTLQIVRDGCQPRLGDMQISLWVSTSGGSNSSVLTRLGKHTLAVYKLIGSGRTAQIRAVSVTGRPVTGTFDYVLDPG